MRVVAIGGEPATGKSTLVERMLEPYRLEASFGHGKLRGNRYHNDLFVLGGYGDGEFGGTDRLPMDVVGDAEEWVEDNAHRDWTVLFEGDRLFHDRFLDHCEEHAELVAFVLTAPPDVLDARHKARGDDQSESWLKGRRTKYGRMAGQDRVITVVNISEADLEMNAHRLSGALPDP